MRSVFEPEAPLGGMKVPRPAPDASPIRKRPRQLGDVFVPTSLSFITCYTANRRPLLASSAAAAAVVAALAHAPAAHEWVVGRYLIMPDHLHFFARAQAAAKSLHEFARDLKQEIEGRLAGELGIVAPVWQPGIFDQLISSADAYAAKWAYVRQNPVRAGWVDSASAWRHSGECEPLRV